MAMSVITRDGSNYIVALEPERILKKNGRIHSGKQKQQLYRI
jgi:hypothetical protein